ncbi:MAG: hypothetical protein AVDCRST_MAG56-2680 [uncultured Cytophagales bacterium]|uniref:SGNH/GDSL hydrolase family protein n=1 Tax=uncultured Cytophagales bacterium TaxID=158755 RepID=A0A6J4IWC9_9SPHI|nr:MAG: hypothetical protein AVDCRST_MAG56-2680 [uncultured Cytophagales bacterium]
MKRKLFLIALLLLAAVVALEIGLRVFFYQQLKTRHFPLVYRPDSLYTYTYIPNATGYISVPDIEKKFRINNYGHNAEDFTLAKDSSVFRIAVSGASNESGLWLNTNDDYVAVLNQLFKRHGHQVEVLNFSIDGRRTAGNFHYIKNFILQFKPDLILYKNPIPFAVLDKARENYGGYVISYNPTNNVSRKYNRALVDELNRNKLLTSVYDYSFIVRAICRHYLEHAENKGSEFYRYLSIYVEKHFFSEDVGWYEYTPEKSTEELKELAAYTAARHAPLVLITFGESAEEKQMLTSAGLKLLDADLRARKFPRRLQFEHDGHWNEYGHSTVANILYELLLESPLIPEKYKNRNARPAVVTAAQ